MERAGQDGRVLLTCGDLFDAVDGGVRRGQAVLVRGNRIERVAPLEALSKEAGVPAEDAAGLAAVLGARLIDLSDAFVMPGLIEGHAHIGMDPSTTVDTMYLHGGYGEITVRSIKNAQADLLAGFTTVRDECSFAYTDVDVRNLIDAGEIWGPRLKVSGLCISATGGHADTTYRPGTGERSLPEAHIGYIVDGRDEATRAARTVVKYGADVVKLMATGGVLSSDASPGAPDLSYEEMKAAVDVARDHGKISSAHAHGAEGIKNAIRAGVTSIEHGTLIDEEGCEMLVEHGTYLVPTIIAHQSSIRLGEAGKLPPAYLEKARAVMRGVHTGLTRLHGMGAKIGFGTDAGTSGNAHGRQTGEFRLMMEEGGFSASEVLLAATQVNSHMLGMEHEIGSIEAGKLADIVAFPESPLSDIDVMGRVSFVMKDGRVYKLDGEPTLVPGV